MAAQGAFGTDFYDRSTRTIVGTMLWREHRPVIKIGLKGAQSTPPQASDRSYIFVFFVRNSKLKCSETSTNILVHNEFLGCKLQCCAVGNVVEISKIASLTNFLFLFSD